MAEARRVLHGDVTGAVIEELPEVRVTGFAIDLDDD